jgi:REP element-mobilizing transposase RayT
MVGHQTIWQTIPNQMKQLALGLPQRGGKRKGAGRKRTGPRPRVSHKPRPRFGKAAPVLVTLRVAFGVWNLRSGRCFRIIEGCLADARDRFGLRVIEFSVLGNHLHLIVESRLGCRAVTRHAGARRSHRSHAQSPDASPRKRVRRPLPLEAARFADGARERDWIRARKSCASLWRRPFVPRPILLFRIRGGTTPDRPVTTTNVAPP